MSLRVLSSWGVLIFASSSSLFLLSIVVFCALWLTISALIVVVFVVVNVVVVVLFCRVLNPPGGRSNNIFGFVDETASSAPNQTNNAHQEALNNKAHQAGDLNIFGRSDHQQYTAPAPQQRAQQASQQQTEVVETHNRMKSNLFGESSGNQPNKPRKGSQRRSTRSIRLSFVHTFNFDDFACFRCVEIAGYNPITGQSFEEEDEARKYLKPAVVAAPVVEMQNIEPAAAGDSRQLKTSSRVLQPPGGKSTALWWSSCASRSIHTSVRYENSQHSNIHSFFLYFVCDITRRSKCCFFILLSLVKLCSCFKF